ncbi:hypothetical protein [Streptomyces sp. NPDC005262]|uniref:hypothetical protein n=1 Tax=Streptomyces sp. NPDC005262 TaxID=3364710 RepID=UPI0036B3FE70
MGFEAGDAAVLESDVGSGSFEPLVEGAVVGGQPTDPLFESGVLGGDPLDRFIGALGLQVPYLAKEFADSGALGKDLALGGPERGLGVQRALAPGCFALVVPFDEAPDPAVTCLGFAVAIAARASGLA